MVYFCCNFHNLYDKKYMVYTQAARYDLINFAFNLIKQQLTTNK
jgi:hypothetical protein